MSKSSAKFKAYRRRCTMTQGDIFDVHRVSEQWVVQSIGSTPPAPIAFPGDINQILADTSAGGPVIPSIADPYGVGTSWQDSCLLRSINWSQEGTAAVADLEWTTRYFYADAAKGMASNVEAIGSATTLGAGLFLPAQVVPVIKTRSTKLLRDNPSMTGPNSANDKTGSDIGGIVKRTNSDVVQVGLRMRLIIDAESLSIDAVTGIVQAYAGKKNSGAFLGYGAGNLICGGGSVNHLENEFWEVVMEYLYDEYFHHSQEAEIGADGRPLMNGSNYSNVQWVRQARGAVNFNDIWPAGDLGKSYKYQCFAGKWW